MYGTELLEREQSLTALSGWLDATVERSGCVVLVSGEAGAGKTALLEAFSNSQQRASRVLWGNCDALFTPRPLAPLHDMARRAGRSLLTPLTEGATRDAIFSAALQELERDRGTALVVIEDVTWADEATLDLIKFVGRRIHRTRAMLVLTYRDDEVGPRHPLRFVIDDLPPASVHHLRLAPLSEVAVAKLARQAGRSAKGLHHVTRGNPFFVTEVLAGPDGPVPATIRDAVLARLAHLSPAAREPAELTAVIPGKAEAWLLEHAAVVDEAAIESCIACGMIYGADGSLSFRHELARRALEDSLPYGRQQSLHGRVLGALARRPGVSPARLVHHANRAGNAPDVLQFAPLAAKQAAAVGAHREAASHLRIALRYAEDLPVEEHANLLEQLSHENYVTDQIDSAIEARKAALALWRSQGARLREGDTQRWLSRLYWFAGRKEEADRYATMAISVLEPLPASSELAMAYSNQSQLAMLAHDTADAIAWANKAIALAESLRNDEILCHALNNRGSAKLFACDEAGIADLRRSLEIALQGQMHEHVARAYTNLAGAAVAQKRFADAYEEISAGLTYCEERDLDAWVPYLKALRARARFDQGQWEAAAEDADTVLIHPRTATVSRIPALIVLGHIRVRRGDPGARVLLDEARDLATLTQELQRIGPLACARAEAAWLAGNTEEAVREARMGYELAENRLDPWALGEVARWLWRLDALPRPCENCAVPYALEMSGDWRGAAREWERLGCPYEQAHALANGGEVEQRIALAILEDLGAAPAAQRLRKQLRAQGSRRVPRHARIAGRHPHGLTERELEILVLLAEGLRNPAIARRLLVSPRTIEQHVEAILTKLNVRSRAEAAEIGRRLARGPSRPGRSKTRQ